MTKYRRFQQTRAQSIYARHARAQRQPATSHDAVTARHTRAALAAYSPTSRLSRHGASTRDIKCEIDTIQEIDRFHCRLHLQRSGRRVEVADKAAFAHFSAPHCHHAIEDFTRHESAARFAGRRRQHKIIALLSTTSFYALIFRLLWLCCFDII